MTQAALAEKAGANPVTATEIKIGPTQGQIATLLSLRGSQAG